MRLDIRTMHPKLRRAIRPHLQDAAVLTEVYHGAGHVTVNQQGEGKVAAPYCLDHFVPVAGKASRHCNR
jgi:hypothetical protein